MTGIWLVSYAALWVLFLVMAIVLLGLVRQIGLVQLRLGPESRVLTTVEGLEYGTEGPDFVGTDLLNGRHVSLRRFRGKPVVLVFFSSSCSACHALAPHLGEFQRAMGRRLHVVLVGQSSAVSLVDLAKLHKVRLPVVADEDGAISKAYAVRATPFAYRLDPRGIVRRRGIVNSFEDLEDLLSEPEEDEEPVHLPNQGPAVGRGEVAVVEGSRHDNR